MKLKIKKLSIYIFLYSITDEKETVLKDIGLYNIAEKITFLFNIYK